MSRGLGNGSTRLQYATGAADVLGSSQQIRASLNAERDHGHDDWKQGSLHDVADRVGLLFSCDSSHPVDWAVRSGLLGRACLVYSLGLLSIARIGDRNLFSTCP
jgi:hypothetical protein